MSRIFGFVPVCGSLGPLNRAACTTLWCMAKNAVYSWRIEAERKAQLEEVARRRKRPLAELLDEAVGQWLRRQTLGAEEDELRVRLEAGRSFGAIAGGDPERASQARERIREKLRSKRRG
jgi:predicted transcriptional regulator